MYEGIVKPTATPYLNVRNAPNGTKVGMLQPNTAVVVERIQDGWAKIVTPVVSNNPDRQWSEASYLQLVDTGGQQPQPDEFILHVKDNVTRKFILEP